MATIRAIVCAAGLTLLAIAGCDSAQLAGLLELQSSADGQDHYIVASLDTVSQSAQDTLSHMGMKATATREGETIRLVSQTESGRRFTLVLTREVLNGVERTRARIEWADGKEDQGVAELWLALEGLGHR